MIARFNNYNYFPAYLIVKEPVSEHETWNIKHIISLSGGAGGELIIFYIPCFMANKYRFQGKRYLEVY